MNDRANMLDEEETVYETGQETPARTDEVLMAASALVLADLEAVTEGLLARRETLRSAEAEKLREQAADLLDSAESEYKTSLDRVNAMLARASELTPKPMVLLDTSATEEKKDTALVVAPRAPRKQKKAAKKAKRKPAAASKNVCNDDEVLKWLPKGSAKADYKVSGISALAQAHKCDVFAVSRSLKRLCEAGKAALGGSPPRWSAYYRL